MGNSFGCSALGERLTSAARDGDLVEARMLLQFNPCLARYSTFAGLNSPLHFAAAKGHNEIVTLLLEHGADVNSRNYCGQTALMHACRYGHWEVVQTLLLYRTNVTRADYLNSRTALHFAAENGHVQCMRLVLADFVPSAPFEFIASVSDGDRSNTSIRWLSNFVNKAADGGATALHMAALNGYFNCVQLLLNLHASVSAVTHHSRTMDLLGAGSTPLHYAAHGGNLKCCQILLERGANRLTSNCNGWLALDVARLWRRHLLEPWLEPNSALVLPTFPLSKYLSLPLMSIINIARECGLQSSGSANESDTCAVCLEKSCTVAAEGCAHELCVRCALYLCSTSNITLQTVGPPGSIPCPLCRHGIISFTKLPGSPAKEPKLNVSLGLCTSCMLQPCDSDQDAASSQSDFRTMCISSVSADVICPVSCSPFPTIAIPSCTCNENPCLALEAVAGGMQDQSPRHSQCVLVEQDELQGARIEKTTCSSIFWNRRSCHREQQCKLEINA